MFTPGKIGELEIKNRFVRAPIYEGLAQSDGTVTDEMVSLYKTAAKGGAGLLCTGYMFAHPLGRAQKSQTGIHKNEMIPGLKKLADAVHKEGSKIAFEISHAGRQTEKHHIGRNPLEPSRIHRDPSFFIKPDEMTEEQILETVNAFVAASIRAVEAGSDVIYLHAGGGDLLNQFLSPFFNKRKDKWGGSAENRFRIMRHIILGIKKEIPGQVPIMVKMNSQDLTPQEGITIELALTYATWLHEIGVNGLELTSGVKFYNHMHCWRGDVPIKEIVKALPLWKKPVGYLFMKSLQGKHNLIEGWNLEAIKSVRRFSGDMALFAVGGIRKKSHMEEIVENGDADFISLARPFIREPFLVKKFLEAKTEEALCVSCNKCIGAVMNQIPTACYHNGLPQGRNG